MTDERLREAERAYRAAPGDCQAALAYASEWMRAGCPGRDPRRSPQSGDVVEMVRDGTSIRGIPERFRSVVDVNGPWVHWRGVTSAFVHQPEIHRDYPQLALREWIRWHEGGRVMRRALDEPDEPEAGAG